MEKLSPNRRFVEQSHFAKVIPARQGANESDLFLTYRHLPVQDYVERFAIRSLSKVMLYTPPVPFFNKVPFLKEISKR